MGVVLRPGVPLPQEAREGLMRAWLHVLRQRHPGVIWVPVESAKRPTSPKK